MKIVRASPDLSRSLSTRGRGGCRCKNRRCEIHGKLFSLVPLKPTSKVKTIGNGSSPQCTNPDSTNDRRGNFCYRSGTTVGNFAHRRFSIGLKQHKNAVTFPGHLHGVRGV